MEVFLTKQLNDRGFIFDIVEDNIVVIENFLLEEELDKILEIIKITPNEDWSLEYAKSLSLFCMEKFGRDDVENLVAEGKYEITQGWNDKNLDIGHHDFTRNIQDRLSSMIMDFDSNLELGGFATLQRMQPGVELKSHTDQHTDPSVKYAAILYINEDYNKGELFFKNKEEREFRPKPGSLLLFPGTEEYEHGVRHVAEGPIRYVLVGFVKVKRFYENNKY